MLVVALGEDRVELFEHVTHVELLERVDRVHVVVDRPRSHLDVAAGVRHVMAVLADLDAVCGTPGFAVEAAGQRIVADVALLDTNRGVCALEVVVFGQAGDQVQGLRVTRENDVEVRTRWGEITQVERRCHHEFDPRDRAVGNHLRNRGRLRQQPLRWIHCYLVTIRRVARRILGEDRVRIYAT